MFIDRLNDKSNLINLVKEFKLIKQDNYSTKFEYENAVINLASSIKLLNTDRVAYEKQTPVIIQFETLHIENWESFLKFVEKKTNSAIQKDLSSMFENYINYVKAIKQFEVEDIQTQLSVTEDESERISLEKKKNILIANKYIERMKDIFESSPISNKENFYAAKIIYDSTNYIYLGQSSVKKFYFVIIILGSLLGIIVALVSNAIKNRK